MRSGGTVGVGEPGAVPPPVRPADGDAWYAPDVRAQREVHPGVVVTVGADGDRFRYRVREPPLSARDERALDRIRGHFSETSPTRPRTREAAAERVGRGFDPKYRRILDRLVAATPAARRRVDYYALCELRCLGSLTPLALDERVEGAYTAEGRLVVRTADFSPAVTDVPAGADHLDRLLSERVERHTVRFREFEVPVVVYRERLLGNDAFDTKYAVLEPDLLPGDRDLIADCKERIWETNVGGVIATDEPWRSPEEVLDDQAAFIASRARRFLSRRLAARHTRTPLATLSFRVRRALADRGVGVPPVADRFAPDRLDDLLYYVLRDFVGDDKLTIPVRDGYLEDIEANRVGERVKVVPRRAVYDQRIPTNLAFEDETRFTSLVTQLAAADGVELNAANPSAKVNVAPAEVPESTTIRCAVALPVISEDGPHVSIRKQSPEAMTPVDLIERGSVSSRLVALLWMLYEYHGVVLFSGPTGVGKTTLMNAKSQDVLVDSPTTSNHQTAVSVPLPS